MMQRILQRCACGDHGPSGGECEACRKKRLQRRAANGARAAATIPPSVHSALAAPGHPLDRSVRSDMESRLGHDFGAVRIHDDRRAADSAAAVEAEAYTVGSQVVFGAGRYAPHSADGRQLLAHELAHVVQQRGAPSRGPIAIVPEDHPSEREAEAVSRRAMDGHSAVPARTANGPDRALYRRAVDDDAHVTCRATRVGAFGTIQAAETEAIRVLRLAAAVITSHLILHPLVGIAGDTPLLHTFRDALWRRFQMDYNTAWVRGTWLPLIARRYELVADWIGRLTHIYRCAAPGVEPPGMCTTSPGGGIAWSGAGDPTTELCDTFWDDVPAEKAATMLHEWHHVGFSWLGDCEASNRNNAVCYDTFARELAGVATPADYVDCCPPPADPLPALTGGPATP